MFEKIVVQTGGESPDRRSKRSRQALIEALIELMAEKTYDSISIKEIVEKANVGRSTFYSHFETKDNLLKSGFDRLLDETLDQIVVNQDSQDLSVDTTRFFRHAAGHHHLYKNLMWGAGLKILTIDEQLVFSEKLRERLVRIFPDETKLIVPLSVFSIVFTGNLMILLKWWLDNKMPYPPEKMNDLFQVLSIPGLRNALKLKAD